MGMTAPDRAAAARAVEDFLRAIGRDPATDPNLVGTGERVADAYLGELCDGYAVDVSALLRENAIHGSTELVVVKDIVVSTTCPHHLLPSRGLATVAFAPREKLLGIGTIVKLVDAFAHRLTLQESIGEEVAAALMAHLAPWWAGCRLVLEHACVFARGERRHEARVESVALRGPVDDAGRAAVYRVLGVGALEEVRGP
jgi:GTP cyclohydrolase I